GRQFRGNSSTGGVWYTDDDFPEAYQNTYFHADYSSGWIRNFGFDEQHNLTFVKDFKLNAGAVVFLTTSPVENGLFYVRYPNQIRRISFIGNSNKKPVAIVETDKNYGASPLTVNFDASQSFDPEFSPLTFNWDFGDNATSTEPNPSVIFEALSNNPTTYTVKLQVRDAQGATSEKIIPISLNNTPPVIVSTSIDQQHSFSARNGATLNLNAIVTDQEHNGQLKYEWQTALFHNGHSHAEPVDNNPATQTSLSPIECDGSTYWFRVTLKVTDPAGLSATYQKDIFPDCAGLPQTINCAPIPDQSITVGDIVLNVTATSGLPVSTYLLEGPATIFGNKIVPSGFPGRVTIRATQGGNETYQPAEPIERSFNIVLPSNASCTAEGLITRDIWNGAGRNTLNDIPVNTTPNQSGTLSNFEVRPFTSADNAQRVRGFICPPVTGIYTFWVASDEDSQLWLSTNADPNNKRLVANLNGSTRANQWNKYASQQSEGIFLVAGNQYYIEGLMNGGGHLSAGWKMPDNSLDRPISGQYLSTFKSKQEQVITFFGIPDKMTTDPAFTIGATANSGLPVDFAIISGPATVAGTTVTLTGEEGVVTIRATQNGNDVYNPAKSVDRRFEVVAPPTVPSVTITSPANGSSFMENQVDIRYTLEGNLAFHDADHLLINLDNQAPIDVHSLNGIYTLYNLSEGLHTVKIQLADSNHRPLANNEATAVTSFNIVPSEKPQTINFFPIANKSTTDIPFAISASATSGLPVLLTIESGPASMNGNLVTLGGAAGTVVVKASQNGNEAYLPAPVVRQSFQVIAPATEKANQTVNFSTIANKYTTDAPFAVAATASSGLPVTLTIESGPASINGNIVTLNGVAGTVVIRASQAGNEQYKRAISFGRSFQVIEKIKQNQLISFASLPDKLTTDQPFSVNATASSGLPVSLSILNGPATISNGVISLTGTAGTVTISASQAGNDSYLAAPNVDRPFTVTAPVVTPPNEPAAVYCELKSDFPWQEWIEQVTFGNIDQRSSKNIYELFDFSTSSFSKESTYSLTVVPKFSWTQSDQYITAWIDYNQDNDFDDAGEEVLRTISKGGFPLQPVDQAIAEVLIPSSAKTGKTRLRIAMQRGS
ncbi:MAG: PKD domain-containing protein, partial [Bacteroidota bacterium]